MEGRCRFQHQYVGVTLNHLVCQGDVSFYARWVHKRCSYMHRDVGLDGLDMLKECMVSTGTIDNC